MPLYFEIQAFMCANHNAFRQDHFSNLEERVVDMIGLYLRSVIFLFFLKGGCRVLRSTFNKWYEFCQHIVLCYPNKIITLVLVACFKQEDRLKLRTKSQTVEWQQNTKQCRIVVKNSNFIFKLQLNMVARGQICSKNPK